MRITTLLAALLAMAPLAAGAQPTTRPAPLVHAHAHNDYAHARPLLDALDNGFCSIEADIYLVDGKLLVGHDRWNLKPQGTIQAMYLDPLRLRVQQNGGRVYVDGPPVQLLIDIKTDAEATYTALHEVLKEYAAMLTIFGPDETRPGAVTVVISGNRPRKTMADQKLRYAACDGLLEDLENPSSVHLVPLVSSRWGISFKWNGVGQMPPKERDLLRQLADKAHKNGQRLRFWGAPDNPAAWTELRDAGVDLVNTDRLPEARQYLLGRNEP